ncbi:AMP-binding protein [Micromonospora sp. NBC_01405]|uniref:hypothetical protein n=1 Tax=Micromonospora sp. NBC_01405 TaxID=2903589 RepID=UPI00324671BB
MTLRYRFVSEHRADYGVQRLCRVQAVRRPGFYEWLAAEPAREQRVAAEDQLATIHGGHRTSSAWLLVRRASPASDPVSGVSAASGSVWRPFDLPIGRPVPQTGVVLLDGTGEIALSGDGLALGYLNDPDETARRFFDRDSVRYYRTGDRGELGPDGELRYRGRIDRQFKIRGVRIEPGEVEAVLRSYPSIASCAVLRVTRRAGAAELACVFSSTDGRPVELAPLRDFAARTLLDAMSPTRFHQVSCGRTGPGIPSSRSGRCSRRRRHR